MLMFALLLPFLAHMDSGEINAVDSDYMDEIVVLEEPSELYEIEFNEEDDLDNFAFEEDEPACLQ